MPVGNPVVTELPVKGCRPTVNLGREIDDAKFVIYEVDPEGVELGHSGMKALFGCGNLLANLISSLAFLPDQIAAMAFEPLLFRSQLVESETRGHDVGNDAFDKREHLPGSR